MQYVKQFFKAFGLVLMIILISTIVITILDYFNLFSESLTNIFLFVITLISIIIGSYKLGKKSSKKGIIEGLKLGIVISVSFMLMGLITGNNFQISNTIYYVILIISSILGSIVGKNRKQV